MAVTKVPNSLIANRPPFTLTDAAVIATDASKAVVFDVTLGGNRTLGAPTNPSSAQRCVWRIRQDGTGSRTLAYNAIFRWGTAGAPTLSTTAGALDYIAAIYHAGDNKWDATVGPFGVT